MLAIAWGALSGACPASAFESRAAMIRYANGGNTEIDFSELLEDGMHLQCSVNNNEELVIQRLVLTEEGTEWQECFSVRGKSVRCIQFYENVGDGVDTTTATMQVRPSYRGGTLNIAGVEEETMVEIYSTDGRLEDRMAVKGEKSIDMTRFGSGVHVVVIGESSYKYTVR